jgi:hypothetical protein
MALLVTKSKKTAYAGSPLSGHWLRGVDLNHRPLGYEPKGSMLSPVDSVALPRNQLTNNQRKWTNSAR